MICRRGVRVADCQWPAHGAQWQPECQWALVRDPESEWLEAAARGRASGPPLRLVACQ
jgi:hypothetical protein